MLHGKMSDISKIFLLYVVAATFSIDGGVGSFASTMAVPLIIIRTGLGAFIVREMTVCNVDKIKKYIYLKNGAIYSILIHGCIMIMDRFGFPIPFWVSPILTFGIVGWFLLKSLKSVPMITLP